MVFSLAARAGPLRLASVATRTSAPRAFAIAQRRGYAEAVSDKLKLSLVVPHDAIYSDAEVTQVNVSAVSGDLGILASHVPTVEELKPGLLEVVESSGSKKFFVSGGFATVHPNNKLTINAVEAYPVDAFSPEAVRSNLAEAQRVASGAGSEEEKAEARIEVDVLTALQTALSK